MIDIEALQTNLDVVKEDIERFEAHHRELVCVCSYILPYLRVNKPELADKLQAALFPEPATQQGPEK